jgi:hypothetical protein
MFIITGLITFTLALPIMFFMTDYPYNAKFLSADDKRYASDRLTYDVGRPVTQKLTFKFVLQVLNDPRLWLLSVPTLCVSDS